MKKMIIPIWLLIVSSLACLSGAAIEKAPTAAPTEAAHLARALVVPTEKTMDCAVVIAAESLHLRSAADPNAEVLTWLHSGAVVDVLDDSNPQWWRVKFEGVEGFARSSFLMDVECVR